MEDPRFARSVVYMCAHSPEGAMGLVVNKAIERLTFPDLLKQLGIDASDVDPRTLIHFGGPVDTGLGFILHSADYIHESTMVVDSTFALTATVDILHAIAQGRGPRRRLMALGYAGWGPGQLDLEIKANGWLLAEADEGLVFDDDLDHKWLKAMGKLGIDPANLVTQAGSA